MAFIAMRFLLFSYFFGRVGTLLRANALLVSGVHRGCIVGAVLRLYHRRMGWAVQTV
jgi:hypothetical protein